MNDTKQQIIWQFIRGDFPTLEFESWLYNNRDFEDIAGETFYLEVISTNFNDKPAVYDIKQKLEEFMRQKLPLNCECIALPNIAITDMGSEEENRIWSVLEQTKPYGETRSWLNLFQCKNCSQYWLVAAESLYDSHCFKRLKRSDAEKIIQNDKWPKCFETEEELVMLCKHSNRFISFVDPLDPSLIHSVKVMQQSQ